MAKFKVKLVLFNNSEQIKYITEEADGAVQAAVQAAKHNPGYITMESDIIEDTDTNTNFL